MIYSTRRSPPLPPVMPGQNFKPNKQLAYINYLTLDRGTIHGKDHGLERLAFNLHLNCLPKEVHTSQPGSNSTVRFKLSVVQNISCTLLLTLNSLMLRPIRRDLNGYLPPVVGLQGISPSSGIQLKRTPKSMSACRSSSLVTYVTVLT